MKFITLNNILHNILKTFKNTTVLQGNDYNLDSSYRKLSIADKLILQENNVRNPGLCSHKKLPLHYYTRQRCIFKIINLILVCIFQKS